MPLGYWEPKDLGPDGQQIFWWGSHGTYGSPPDHDRGFIAHTSTRLCDPHPCWSAAQRVGTYNMQGPSKSITSTYGYNGYYLSPCKTPGWAFDIGKRPWQYVGAIASPTDSLSLPTRSCRPHRPMAYRSIPHCSIRRCSSRAAHGQRTNRRRRRSGTTTHRERVGGRRERTDFSSPSPKPSCTIACRSARCGRQLAVVRARLAAMVNADSALIRWRSARVTKPRTFL